MNLRCLEVDEKMYLRCPEVTRTCIYAARRCPEMKCISATWRLTRQCIYVAWLYTNTLSARYPGMHYYFQQEAAQKRFPGVSDP
jgi:hypothetical protein